MSLYVRNRFISATIPDILLKIKSALSNGKLRDIKSGSNYLSVSCPVHKHGLEKHASCVISLSETQDKYAFGDFHCFTCGITGSFSKFVALCFDISEEEAEEYLINNFSDSAIADTADLPEISFNSISKQYIDDSILTKYNYYHPYMYQRQLTKAIIDKFQIGYDREANCITFPVWDEKNNLVAITRRAVYAKKFFLPQDIPKPVYLLNFILAENHTTVYVTESQINALTLWTWGYPAIALFGTGSAYQYDKLRRSGIRNYILCFDGDEAGDKGTQRFIDALQDSALISIKHIPRGKDVNDLSKTEFEQLSYS